MKTILYTTGDATHPIGVGPNIIAHCCNNVGAWGAGFVLAISKRWPDPERAYRTWARLAAPLPLGDVQFVHVPEEITVANIIGQEGTGSCDGRPPVRYKALAIGFAKVAEKAKQLGASVHMPRLGCGLAGGKWEQIEPLIKQSICAAGIEVVVYDLAPTGGAR